MLQHTIGKTPRFVNPNGSLTVQQSKIGLLMGNRGTLGPILKSLPQPHASRKPWITCILKKNGVPIPKTDVAYTRLFFLDEVTAFAAGHRPCYSCQRERYGLFVEIWGKVIRRDANDMDEILHRDRCNEDGSKKTFPSILGDLPSGVMVMLPASDQPYLLLWNKLFPWNVEGYGKPLVHSISTMVHVLTPISIVQILKEGFPLLVNRDETVHSSILEFL